jgi:hypothetical protein
MRREKEKEKTKKTTQQHGHIIPTNNEKGLTCCHRLGTGSASPNENGNNNNENENNQQEKKTPTTPQSCTHDVGVNGDNPQ